MFHFSRLGENTRSQASSPDTAAAAVHRNLYLSSFLRHYWPGPAANPERILLSSHHGSSLSAQALSAQDDTQMPQVAMQMEFAGLSDVGRSRSRNEDSYRINPESGLALVCDGMGGHAGGDIASRTASETIDDFVVEYDPDSQIDDDPDEEDDSDGDRTVSERAALDPAVGQSIATIRAAVQLANRRLLTLNQERGYADGRGMGTTVVGMWLVAGTDKLVVFHAGDSRLYRLRGGELRQLTRDHSLYQAWLDSGAQGHPPHRNIIVRALGTMREVEPEVSLQVVADGDLFLLCSDGLTSMVGDDAIAEAVRAIDDLDGGCKRLVTMANEKGGHDNVTVILGRARPAGS